jgi:photosystem II stability/assembly factor-like uncharacterized protein
MKPADVSRARVLTILLGASCFLLPAADAQQTAKVKGIWEPANYPADVNFQSVFFVNDKIGWIGGSAAGSKGGMLLYTSDGGERWDVQLGDAGSNEPPFTHIKFLDQTHGWAVQSNQKLLRTSDGKNWEEAGSFPKFQPFHDYVFTSPQKGTLIAGYADNSRIFSTKDGGRSWSEDFQCGTTLQVQGLTKNVRCHLNALAFPSPQVGYVGGGGYNGGYSVIAKTEDGGATWRMIFASTDLESVVGMAFTDETHGVIRLKDRKVFATDDGGKSWRGIPASLSGQIQFTDPAVGWSCAGRSCSLTTDGGQHWASRDVRLPANIESYSAPRRDRMFLVGAHGMIYRYRVVPASYTAQGIADAPLLPAYGSPLTTQLAGIQSKVRDLQARIAKSGGDAAAAATASAPAQGTQDSLSATMQGCCGAQVVSLQSDLTSFSQEVPAFAGGYRNLNLFFVGMNMAPDLITRATGIRDAFLKLKDAPSPEEAAAALQDLASRLDDTYVVVANGFANLSASPVQPVSAGVSNMLAPQGAAVAPNTAAAPAAAPANAPATATDNVGKAAEEVGNALKRFLRR